MAGSGETDTERGNLMQKGNASILFEKPPAVGCWGCIAGKKEAEGPLGGGLDRTETDDRLGQETWEAAESELQRRTARLTLKKAGLKAADIRYLFAGDLLGQLTATSFGVRELGIPLFGLYGACSTMGEAMALAAVMVHAGAADRVLAMASSHFATAEKQFRFPLGYGAQRPSSASWTVTGCGAVVVENRETAAGPETSGGCAVTIAGVTPGRIVDAGVRDSMNMGAAMAPAAAHTICRNLEDLQTDLSYYDRIITGDLGEVGSRALLDLLKKEGLDLEPVHADCGKEIYDRERQDVHAGGSGSGCCAVTLCARILPNLRSGTWKRVLFLPTGALLSPVSFNEGRSVPGIAHGIILEARSPMD